MSADRHILNIVSPMADVVDDAVGVAKSKMQECKWFVAIVNYNSEKTSSENLSKQGIMNYLPIQTELRQWKNGRRVKVNKIVIPSTIFIYCTEQKRREIVRLPFINRFMTNKASGALSTSYGKPLAIIPDNQIKRLKFMLGQSDIPVIITEKSYRVGSRVRVIRGSLTGLEGEVSALKTSKSELIVNLDIIGCAHLSIDTSSLELLYN